MSVDYKLIYRSEILAQDGSYEIPKQFGESTLIFSLGEFDFEAESIAYLIQYAFIPGFGWSRVARHALSSGFTLVETKYQKSKFKLVSSSSIIQFYISIWDTQVKNDLVVKIQANGFDYESSQVPINPLQGETWKERDSTTNLIKGEWERVDAEWMSLKRYTQLLDFNAGKYDGFRYYGVVAPSSPKFFIEKVESLFSVQSELNAQNFVILILQGEAFPGQSNRPEIGRVTINSNPNQAQYHRVNWNVSKIVETFTTGVYAVYEYKEGNVNYVSFSTTITSRAVR